MKQGDVPKPGAQTVARALREEIKHLGDFTTGPRVLVIAAIAVVVGTAGVICGVLLLRLIRLVTNIAYFGAFSLANLKIGNSPLGAAAIVVPVIGSLIVGLMARYGTEKIRGHGIPEAIEAILLGRSRLDVKVAILKPLSSAIRDRHRRAVRRGRPDYYDRRRHRLVDRTSAADQRRRAKGAAGRRRGGRHDDRVRHTDRLHHAGC